MGLTSLPANTKMDAQALVILEPMGVSGIVRYGTLENFSRCGELLVLKRAVSMGRDVNVFRG